MAIAKKTKERSNTAKTNADENGMAAGKVVSETTKSSVNDANDVEPAEPNLTGDGSGNRSGDTKAGTAANAQNAMSKSSGKTKESLISVGGKDLKTTPTK